MDENPILKTSEGVPKESQTISIDAVKFPKTWTIWEGYAAKEKKLSYEESMKPIFDIDNLITFWQFWNHYPGSNPMKIFFNEKVKYFFKEKYRINALNFFVKNIKPAWEDENNKGGKYLQFEYKVDNNIELFFKSSASTWKKLVLNTMAENYPGAEYVFILFYNFLGDWNKIYR